MNQSSANFTSSPYQLCTGVYNLRHLSTSKAQERNRFDIGEINMVETILTMLVSLNGIATTQVQKLVDMVKASDSKDKMERYGTVQMFAKSGAVRAMNNRLQNLNNKYSKSIEDLCGIRIDPQLVSKLTNAMDYTDECLKDIVDAMTRFFNFRTTRNLISKPADPMMLSCFMKTLVLCDLSAVVYDYITSDMNFPYLKNFEKYRRLRMNQITDQVINMINKFDFLDSNGNVLEYKVLNVFQSSECSEIISDVLVILFSYEYLEKMLEARNGVKPTFTGGSKSIIASYEDMTKPLSFYSEKYKNYKIDMSTPTRPKTKSSLWKSQEK